MCVRVRVGEYPVFVFRRISVCYSPSKAHKQRGSRTQTHTHVLRGVDVKHQRANKKTKTFARKQKESIKKETKKFPAIPSQTGDKKSIQTRSRFVCVSARVLPRGWARVCTHSKRKCVIDRSSLCGGTVASFLVKGSDLDRHTDTHRHTPETNGCAFHKKFR